MQYKKLRIDKPETPLLRLKIFYLLLGIISLILVYRPLTAKIIDSYILYHVDDIARFTILRSALRDVRVFLSPYLKLGFALLNFPFLLLTGANPMSIRILNFFLSLATLVLIKKIALKKGISKFGSELAMVLCFSFPVFFILSLSTLSEVLFTFTVVLSVYMLVCQRYGAGLIIISFLPLLRQEGLLLLPVFAIILARRYSLLKTPILFIPFIIWSYLNVKVLGHEMYFSFFPALGIIPSAPANSSASLTDVLFSAGVLLFHPISLLGILGALLSFKKKNFRLVSLIFLSYFLILLAANLLHVTVNGVWNREIRFLHTLIPFLSLLAVYYMDLYPGLTKVVKKYIFILPLLTIFQIRMLQNERGVRWDYLSYNQEKELKEATNEILELVEKEGIKNIYIPGELYTNPIIRRIWYYSPSDMDLYILIEFPLEDSSTLEMKALDLGLSKFRNLESGERGVYLSTRYAHPPSETLKLDEMLCFDELGLEAYIVKYE
ncbi:MAG: hypothetical protein GX817_03030 [Elusimicrobia bacterium]|nr:hypothetical protein [Elusimicrobiota bacterium]